MLKHKQQNDPSIIAPMPATCQERIAALRNLGATFSEGQREICKIATPTGDENIPTFLDTTRIEELLLRKASPSSLEVAATAAAFADPPTE